MLIKVANKVWIVNFRHGKQTSKTPEANAYEQRGTIARMRPHGFAKGVNEVSASVTCDSRDNFIKTEGRKRALKKLINSMKEFEAKATRAEFWNNYIAQANV